MLDRREIPIESFVGRQPGEVETLSGREEVAEARRQRAVVECDGKERYLALRV